MMCGEDERPISFNDKSIMFIRLTLANSDDHFKQKVAVTSTSSGFDVDSAEEAERMPTPCSLPGSVVSAPSGGLQQREQWADDTGQELTVRARPRQHADAERCAEEEAGKVGSRQFGSNRSV
jgi:hypothetical protein